MALININFYSEKLGFQTSVDVVIPQKSTSGQIGLNGKADNKEYKCLYLLHGLTDDQTIWLRRTSIERYATEYGVCVVMPFGGRSFYTNIKNGSKYFDYITEELPKVISEFLNVSTKREDTFIAGNSMGGYGALKAALSNPDKYCAAAGLSAVSDIRAERFKEVLIPVLGEGATIPDEMDIHYLAEKTNSNPVKPRIYMCVGTGDFLYETNVKLKEKFEALDYDYTYLEGEGEHNWYFWDEYIQYVLKWMFDTDTKE